MKPFKLFSTSGTAGDSYICALQLYELAKTEDIHVNHFCEIDGMDELCTQIFKYFDITCHIVKQRDTDNVRIHSDFVNGLPVGVTPFPKVDYQTMARSMFGISFDTYNCIQLKAGKEPEKIDVPEGGFSLYAGINKKRDLMLSIFESKIKQCAKNGIRTVLVGGHHIDIDLDRLKSKQKLVNASNQCHIWESFDVIKHCNEFYGHQGLLVYYALSQKIPCYVFYRKPWEKEAFEKRCLPEWKDYIKDLSQI